MDLPRTNICTVKYLFVVVSKKASAVRKATTNPSCTNSSNSKSLVPTSGYGITRKSQIHPSITRNFGWTADENGWVPVMTKLPQTQLSTLLSANALRRDAELNCTDLCSCSEVGNFEKIWITISCTPQLKHRSVICKTLDAGCKCRFLIDIKGPFKNFTKDQHVSMLLWPRD